jgi:hypothetical protein
VPKSGERQLCKIKSRFLAMRKQEIIENLDSYLERSFQGAYKFDISTGVISSDISVIVDVKNLGFLEIAVILNYLSRFILDFGVDYAVFAEYKGAEDGFIFKLTKLIRL